MVSLFILAALQQQVPVPRVLMPVADLDIVVTPDGTTMDLIWTPLSTIIPPNLEGGGEIEVPLYDHEVHYSFDTLTEDNWSAALPLTDPVIYNFTTGKARMTTQVPMPYVPTSYGVRWTYFTSTSPLSNVVNLTVVPAVDTLPPDAVTDLSATSSSGSVHLKWTAPWDNNRTSPGSAGFDLRYSTVPLTDQAWPTASPIASSRPGTAGIVQAVSVDLLSAGQVLHFAVKTSDSAANWSAISNVASIFVEPDLGPPSAVVSFSIASELEDAIELSWIAPGDDALVGRASAYDLRVGDRTVADEVEFLLLAPIPAFPLPEDAGRYQAAMVYGLQPDTSYHFAIRASDELSHWSPIVAVQGHTPKPSGSLGSTQPCSSGGGSIGAWVAAVGFVLLVAGVHRR